MATQVQNAVAILNAAYNSRKPEVTTMPAALRDRFLAAYRKQYMFNGTDPTNEQIAAVMNNAIVNLLLGHLDFAESADLTAANRAQNASDLAPSGTP